MNDSNFDKSDEIKNIIKKYHKELINNESYIFENIKKEFENIKKFILIYTNFYYLELDYLERLQQILNLINFTKTESEININNQKKEEFSYINILYSFRNTLINIFTSHKNIVEEIKLNLLNEKKEKMFKNFENIENEYLNNKILFQFKLKKSESEINSLEHEYINEVKNNINSIFRYLQKNYKKNNEKIINNLETIKNSFCKEKEESYIKSILDYNNSYINYYKENYKFFFKIIKYQFDTFNDILESIQIFTKIYSNETNNINKYYKDFFDYSKHFNIEKEIKNLIFFYKDCQSKKPSFNKNINNINDNANNKHISDFEEINNNNYENINDNNNDNNGIKTYITRYENDQLFNEIKKKYNTKIFQKSKELILSFYNNSNNIKEKLDNFEEDNEKVLEDEINNNIYNYLINIIDQLIEGKLSKKNFENFKNEINLSKNKTKFFLDYLNKNRGKLILINENAFDLIVEIFENILNKNKNYPNLIEYIIILSQTFSKKIDNNNNNQNNNENNINNNNNNSKILMQDIIKKFNIFKEKKVWILIIIFRINNDFLSIKNKNNKRKNSKLNDNKSVNLYSISENKIKELNNNTVYSTLLTYKFNMQNFNFDQNILNKILFAFIKKYEIADNENNLLPKDYKINVDDKELKEIENIIDNENEILINDEDNFNDDNNNNNNNNKIINNKNENNNVINENNDSNIIENDNKLNNSNINENNSNNEIENNNKIIINNSDNNNNNIENNNNNNNEINNDKNNNIII